MSYLDSKQYFPPEYYNFKLHQFNMWSQLLMVLKFYSNYISTSDHVVLVFFSETNTVELKEAKINESLTK